MPFHKVIGQLFRHGRLHVAMEFSEESTARAEMEKLIRSPSDLVFIFYGEIAQPLTKICKTCLGRGWRPKSDIIKESLCPGCDGTGREPDVSQKTEEEL